MRAWGAQSDALRHGDYLSRRSIDGKLEGVDRGRRDQLRQLRKRTWRPLPVLLQRKLTEPRPAPYRPEDVAAAAVLKVIAPD